MDSECYVYVIQAGANGPVKIGMGIDPTQRMRGMQTAHYETLALIHTTGLGSTHDARLVEKAAHTLLREQRKGLNGEWFAASTTEAIQAIAKARETLQTKGALGLPQRPQLDPMYRLRRYCTPEMQNSRTYDEYERKKDHEAYLKHKAMYAAHED